MKKKKLTLKGRVKKWFNDKILHQYLQGIDANFVNFFTDKKKHGYIFEDNEKYLQENRRIMKVLSSDKYKKFFYKVVNFFEDNEKYLQENRRIMKVLSSDKYKKFFYKVVNYNPAIPESVVIKPYGNTFSDRLKNIVAQIYIYLFRKDLYSAIKLFSKWKPKINEERINRAIELKILDEKINNYMATTTVEERINRAIELKIITADDAKEFWDTTDYSKPVPPSYPVHPYDEKKEANPVPMERYNQLKKEREEKKLKTFKLPVPPEPHHSMSDKQVEE